jgi:hypothetical protein
MHALQAAWTHYLSNPSQVLNGLALFYALAGSWLWIATQWRSSRVQLRMATSPASVESLPSPATLRVNRLFYTVGGLCLALALLLTLLANRF